MMEVQVSEERMDQKVNDIGSIIIHWKQIAFLTQTIQKKFPVRLNVSIVEGRKCLHNLGI